MVRSAVSSRQSAGEDEPPEVKRPWFVPSSAQRAQEDHSKALGSLKSFASALERTFPSFAASLRDGMADTLAVKPPRGHRHSKHAAVHQPERATDNKNDGGVEGSHPTSDSKPRNLLSHLQPAEAEARRAQPGAASADHRLDRAGTKS